MFRTFFMPLILGIIFVFAYLMSIKPNLFKSIFILLLFTTQSISAQKMNVLNANQVAALAHTKPDSGQTVVLNFWATWCGPCVRELPYFVQADTSLRDENFKFIFVSFDPTSNESKVQKFIAKNGLPGEHYIIGQYDMGTLLDMVHPKWQGGIPFTLVITNKETKHHEGAFENFRQLWQFIRD